MTSPPSAVSAMPPSRFESIDSDILQLVFVEALRSQIRDLKALSTTSKYIRELCTPILFRNCTGRTYSRGEFPPQAIRPYVRHVTYEDGFVTDQYLAYRGYWRGEMPLYYNTAIDSPLFTKPPPRYVKRAFGTELDLFPHLRSVDFRFAFGGVPWYILKECLSHPNITAISFSGSDWTCVPPPPKSALKFILRHRLTAFSYAAREWREIQVFQTENNQSRLDAAYKLEADYLRSFVLGMADSVESLSLPIETSPLARMSSLDWPRLQSLHLTGPHFDPALCNILPALLSRMPSLHSLSVHVHPRRGLPRPLLVTSMSTGSWYRQLRSLSIGYPVPEDNVFPLVTELTHLSLRDAPRYYMRERHRRRMPMSERPLLSATACLGILRRMSLQRLRSLELAYRADESEDELLQYLASGIPKLQVLELHRYAATEPDPEDDEPAEEVPYTHIAHALTSIPNLRIAHLNFDLGGDSYMFPWHVFEFREEQITVLAERGQAIAAILSACPQFEYVSLLSHQYEGGKWILFRPPWHGDLVNCLDIAPRYHHDASGPPL